MAVSKAEKEYKDSAKKFKDSIDEMQKATRTFSSTINSMTKVDLISYKKEINEANNVIKQNKRELTKSSQKINELTSKHSILGSTLQQYNSVLLRAVGGIVDVITSFRNQRKLQIELTKVLDAKLKIEQQNKRKLEAEKVRAEQRSSQLITIQQSVAEPLAKKQLVEQQRRDFEDSAAKAISPLSKTVKRRQAELAKLEKQKEIDPTTVSDAQLADAQSLLKRATTRLQNKKGEIKEISDQYDDEIKELTSELQKAADAYNATAKPNERLKSNLSNLDVRVAQASLDVEKFSDELDLSNSTIAELTEDARKAKLDQTFVPLNLALDKLTQVLNDFAFSIRDTQKTFGISAGNAIKLQFNNLVSSIKSFSNSLFSLGDKVFVTTEEILSAQAAYQQEFGGVIISEASSALAQQAKELGVSVEQLIAARRVFMTSALGDVMDARAIQETFINQFQAQGFTSKEALELSVKYSDIIARNGNRFQDSFIRAALEAKKIGVDLGKIDQVGDNIINNFEGFLESQAELGAMGFGFDTSRLAELAEYGDTGALARELQVQLASTGKDLQSLTRSQRLAIENAFGLSIAEMQRMASGAGGGEELTDQQKTNKLLENLTNVSEVTARASAVMAFVSKTIHSLLLEGILINTSRTAGGLTSLGQIILNKFPSVGGMASGGLGAIGKGVLGAAVGIGAGTGVGMAMGASTTSSMIGSILGTIAGGILGFMMGGPLGASIGMALGGTAGGGIAGLGSMISGDDFVSNPGYGSRVLLTQNKAIALNNDDKFVAYANDLVSTETGLQFFNKGALVNDVAPVQSTQKLDTTALETKMDNFLKSLDTNLRTALSSTHVYMDGVSVGRRLANANSAIDAVGVFGVQGYRGNPTY